MKITALEEYGLRCLLRVAEQCDGDAISANEIAEQEGLSLSYAQKIMRVLSKGDLVDSRRGASGGYVLVDSPHDITVGDAIRVLGGMFEVGDICDRHTGEFDECANRCNCGIRPVWAHISEFVVETLDGISLAVLLQDDSEVARHLDEHLPNSNPSVSSSPTH